MTDLAPTPALDPALDIRHGAARLQAWAPGRLTQIAAYGPEDATALAEVLERAHGLPCPGPGESASAGTARLWWFGRDAWLLIGPPPDAALAEVAALTDQSDGWAGLRLSGAGAAQVLARLVPIDLAPAAFAEGATARCPLRHVPVALSRTGAEAFELLGPRSMAGTLVEEVERAMRRVAGRAALAGMR